MAVFLGVVLIVSYIYIFILIEERDKLEARLKLMSNSIYKDFEKIVKMNGKRQSLPDNIGFLFRKKYKIDYSNLHRFTRLIDKRLQKQDPYYAAIVANIYIKIGPMLLFERIFAWFAVYNAILTLALLYSLILHK